MKKVNLEKVVEAQDMLIASLLKELKGYVPSRDVFDLIEARVKAARVVAEKDEE